MADLATVEAARRDAGLFAELLLGAPLWAHQLEVVRSSARYRVICAGRQVGKSRLLAVLALHQAFSRAGSLTLLVSAGDTASKRLLGDIAALAQAAPLLSGSVVDETSQVVILSNGSTVRSVPASMAQIRGWAIDLLVVDEAAFLDPEVWRAAEPTVIARPGSRVVLSSSPWGPPDHFFRALWARGMATPSDQIAAWHWPSIVSPLVDAQLLEEIRERETPTYFAREFLAEWTDSSGAYFTTAELEGATGDYQLVDLEDVDAVAALGVVCGGVDWAFSRDAHALTVIAALPERDERGRQRYWIPFIEERFALSYEAWIDRLAEIAGVLSFSVLVAETNGVGQMPTQVLARRLWEMLGRDLVDPVATTSRVKEDAFGFVKLLLQQHRLVLPRHPSLLRQLGALEFSFTEGGTMRIAVPERAGHDDVAMSLALGVLALMAAELVPAPSGLVEDEDLFPELRDFQISVF